MTRLYDTLIGIPWFRPETYDIVRARMDDAHLMPTTYDLWRQGAEQREQNFRRDGASTHRVDFDLDAFLAFCAKRNLLVTDKARQQWAMSVVAHGFKSNVADYDHPFFRHGSRGRKRR